MGSRMPQHGQLARFLFVAIPSVLLGYEFTGSHVESISSCTLSEYTNEFKPVSEFECALECLGKQDSGDCAAYQWHAETGSCRLQKKLHVTASNEENVSVMSSAVDVCVNDTDCPAHEKCEAQDCLGLKLCVSNATMDDGSSSCSVDGDCPPNHTCVDHGDSNACLADDCSAILNALPYSQSGKYTIVVGAQQIPVWCDMEIDGGGWTVFLKRLDGSVDFYVDRAAYKQGFGTVNGEYWLGLDALHAMTSSKSYQLRADISDWEGASAHSLYSSIYVAGEPDGNKLSLGVFLGGDGGDGLNGNRGRQFTTRDHDRDVYSGNCAVKHSGGFWYNLCSTAFPTSKYYIGGPYENAVNDGIQWRTWGAHYNDAYYSMKTLELKIRP